MSTTINFAVPLLDSDNNPALDGTGQGVTLGKLLSNEIMGAAIDDDPMKYFIWALDIRRGGSITLEDADKAKLVSIITSSTSLTVLGKGRLIETIQNADIPTPLPTAPLVMERTAEPFPEVAPEQVVAADTSPEPSDPGIQQVSDISNQPG